MANLDAAGWNGAGRGIRGGACGDGASKCIAIESGRRGFFFDARCRHRLPAALQAAAERIA
ncbi:MAG: hypothetical protein ACREP7_21940 [Lysobacter sp.]